MLEPNGYFLRLFLLTVSDTVVEGFRLAVDFLTNRPVLAER